MLPRPRLRRQDSQGRTKDQPGPDSGGPGLFITLRPSYRKPATFLSHRRSHTGHNKKLSALRQQSLSRSFTTIPGLSQDKINNHHFCRSYHPPGHDQIPSSRHGAHSDPRWHESGGPRMRVGPREIICQEPPPSSPRSAGRRTSTNPTRTYKIHTSYILGCRSLTQRQNLSAPSDANDIREHP